MTNKFICDIIKNVKCISEKEDILKKVFASVLTAMLAVALVTTAVVAQGTNSDDSLAESTIVNDFIEAEPETTFDVKESAAAPSQQNVDLGMPELTSVGVDEIPQEQQPSTRNISNAYTNYTLAGSSNQTIKFDLRGHWGSPLEHNRVRFVISNFSGGKYAINLKNTTTGAVIVSGEIHTSSYSFTLSGTQGNDYEFSIVNPTAYSITYDLAISSNYE